MQSIFSILIHWLLGRASFEFEFRDMFGSREEMLHTERETGCIFLESNIL